MREGKLEWGWVARGLGGGWWGAAGCLRVPAGYTEPGVGEEEGLDPSGQSFRGAGVGPEVLLSSSFWELWKRQHLPPHAATYSNATHTSLGVSQLCHRSLGEKAM